MSDTIIRVEGLGKKYSIRHEKSKRYVALRDVIADKASRLKQRLSSPVQNSSRSHEDFWALKDVSFEVKQGDRIGIVGRNGAGKSTLLKVLSRITEPTTGVIELKGRVASLLEVGTGFHPELTGRENIFLNGAILGMSRTEINQKFDEIVDFAEVERFLDAPVKRYSSGMYVKLAFSVAAHLEPEILIVDEVLAVGDMQFQKKCIGKMENVAEKEGRTILLVSHNMSTIQNLCRSAIFMSQGEISMRGSVGQVVSQYLFDQQNIVDKYQWQAEDIMEDVPVRLISARVRSEDCVDGEIDISKEITIEFMYENLEDSIGLYSSIHLKDTYGNTILASVNFPSGTLEKDEYACGKLRKGRYLSRCILPKNFLNNATYSINILILKHDMSIVTMHEDILRFEGIDTGEMREEFNGAWIGSIRPKLLWNTAAL